MFRGRSGDVGWDFLGTFWGPIFAGWVITCKDVFVEKMWFTKKVETRKFLATCEK